MWLLTSRKKRVFITPHGHRSVVRLVIHSTIKALWHGQTSRVPWTAKCGKAAKAEFMNFNSKLKSSLLIQELWSLTIKVFEFATQYVLNSSWTGSVYFVIPLAFFALTTIKAIAWGIWLHTKLRLSLGGFRHRDRSTRLRSSRQSVNGGLTSKVHHVWREIGKLNLINK